MARIEVRALSYGEATTALGTSAGIPAGGSAGVPAGGATLAELYALRDGAQAAIDRPPVLHGQYL